MIAISPWFSRLVRNLVRLSIRATALTPGLSSEACRPRLNSREARSLDCGRGSVPVPDSLIDSHPARADHLAWVTTEDQACPHHCPASLLLTAVLCLLPLSPGAPRHVPCPVPNPQDRRASGRVHEFCHRCPRLSHRYESPYRHRSFRPPDVDRRMPPPGGDE